MHVKIMVCCKRSHPPDIPLRFGETKILLFLVMVNFKQEAGGVPGAPVRQATHTRTHAHNHTQTYTRKRTHVHARTCRSTHSQTRTRTSTLAALLYPWTRKLHFWSEHMLPRRRVQSPCLIYRVARLAFFKANYDKFGLFFQLLASKFLRTY